MGGGVMTSTNLCCLRNGRGNGFAGHLRNIGKWGSVKVKEALKDIRREGTKEGKREKKKDRKTYKGRRKERKNEK